MVGVQLFLAKGDYQVLVADLVKTLATSGLVVLVNADEVAVTDTIKAVNTTEKSFILGANNYSTVIVEGEVEIDFGATSLNQTIQVSVWSGVAQKQSYSVQSLAAKGSVVFPFKVSFADAAGSTIAIKQSGLTGADANTTIFVNSLRIYGVL